MSKPIISLAEFQTTFAPKPVEVEVKVPGTEASVTVFLKPLTSAQRDRFEASVVGIDGKRNLENLRARLVADCLVTDTGAKVGKAEAIGELDARLVGALFDKVRELNGMDAEAVEEAGKD
jgi:hypothetical protein